MQMFILVLNREECLEPILEAMLKNRPRDLTAFPKGCMAR